MNSKKFIYKNEQIDSLVGERKIKTGVTFSLEQKCSF